jgi:hypothetical protein
LRVSGALPASAANPMTSQWLAPGLPPEARLRGRRFDGKESQSVCHRVLPRILARRGCHDFGESNLGTGRFKRSRQSRRCQR